VPVPRYAAPLFSAFLGCLYASLFFLGHETGHGAVLRARLAQDLLMWAAFLIFLVSPTLWRVWHNKVHHAHTNSVDFDPDNFGTLSAYKAFRSVRIVAVFTPGSGRWLSWLYLPTWFTVHAQVVLWIQSHQCRGFESLNRKRAAAESLAMAAFWTWLAGQLGAWPALLLIVIPMLVANTIIMSYVVTNHFLRPLVDRPDPLENTMSVTTHPTMDLIHFNFSHHVEHHLFPAMSSRYAPLVRAKLRQYAGERFLAPPHARALLLVFRTPRIHDQSNALVNPATGHRIVFTDITKALCSATLGHPTKTPGGMAYEPEA
jgi:fatty acid desaturase